MAIRGRGRRILPVAMGLILTLFATGTAVFAESGSLDIISTAVGTRVYVDDEYRGDANIFIRNVPAGERTVMCRQGSRRISGTFTLKEGETLRLEARFDEDRIVDLSLVEKAERSRQKQEKEEKAREDKAERERVAKQAEAERARQQKQPVVDEQAMHRDMFSVAFDYTSSNAFVATPSVNSKILKAFSEKKNQTGTFTRAMANTLMCKTLPCTATWSASFTYVDEKGTKENFKLAWTEATFEYVTLDGVSKRELEWCVNNNCLKLRDPDRFESNPKPVIDRYALTWTKSSLAIKRADLAR